MMKFLAILLIISIASVNSHSNISKKLKRLHTKLDVLIAHSQGYITLFNQTPYDMNYDIAFKNGTSSTGSVHNYAKVNVDNPSNDEVSSITAQTQSQPTMVCTPYTTSGSGNTRTIFGICYDGVTDTCKICPTQSVGCCV